VKEECEQLVHFLAEAIPSLAPILAENIADYDELLPHLFFGEMVPWAEDREKATDLEIEQMISLLDTAYATGDYYVRNLIEASFLENLYKTSRLVARLGPSLTAARERIIEAGGYAGT
jgi:hypothetical protein